MVKFHKIRNVPLDVCSAEAMIAYNYAFSSADIFRKRYRAATSTAEKADIAQQMVDMCSRNLECNAERNNSYKRYNMATIVECLRAGVADYLTLTSGYIMSSYADVGALFNPREEGAQA